MKNLTLNVAPGYVLRFSDRKESSFKDGSITVVTFQCDIISKDRKHIYESFKVTGKAVCSKDDAVNKVLGSRIAESRAKTRAYNKAAEQYKDTDASCIEHLIDVAGDACFAMQMKHLAKTEAKHVEYLIHSAD